MARMTDEEAGAETTLKFIVGITFVLIGGFLFLYVHKLKRDCTEQTEGTVDNSFATLTKGSYSAPYPLFTYKVNDLKYFIASNPQFKPREGSKVMVFYDPQNPKKHYVAESIIMKLAGMAGALVVIFGIAILLSIFIDFNSIINKEVQ